MHALGSRSSAARSSSSSSVCLQCQFRLLVVSRTRARARARHHGISRCSSTSAIATPPAIENEENEAVGTQQLADEARTSPSDAASSTGPPPAARLLRPDPSRRRSHSLAMFQSIVERQARAPSIPGVSTGGTASIELVQDVARMQAMLEREGATLAAAYAYFDERIYPQIAKDPAGVPQIVKNQVAAVLLNRLALEKPRDFESGRLPSVTRITEVMIELDVLRPSAWATLVIELIQHIYRQTTVPDAYSSIQDYETAMARRDALLRDLLGAWKAFCAQRPTPESDSPVKQSKPASPGAGANPRQKLTLQQAFGELFPQHLVPNLLKPTFAAFATYKLLTDPVNRSRSIKGDAAPFLQMMQGLISRARPPRPGDFLPISDAFPDLPRFVWPKKQPDGGSGTSTQSMFVYRDKSTELRVTVHRQLGDAIKARNLGAVKKAWLEFWGEAAVPDASRVAQLVQHPDMFDYFILAYTVMRRPQQAIEVWKNMERIGIQATIKTWNSMLQGCINAGNAHGINTVWSRLVASGTKLDKAIWTARIHGLFVCGEPDAGIRALDEMAKIWAARQDPRYAAIAVQPTVEPVNAALAGLLRLKRDSDATKVLAWASRQGISPDIYTFNTLLRPLIRRGDMKGIDEVFDTMRSINIHADIATFTILLEGTLNHVGDLAPDQQVALVERILGAMKASGVEINMQAYAKMLHVLLREGDRAGAPVKAVLAHIWGRGLELTSHIYTMLAEHYFSRDPPDAAAVTALIENRRLRENRGIDRVFWERVVRGYCDAGELPRALDIFDRVLAAGSTVTLATLYDLLRSLVAAGDLAAARRVVEAGRKIGRAEEPGAGAGAGGLAEGAAGGRYWRHRFWHLAYHHGLLGDQLALRFREANEGSL